MPPFGWHPSDEAREKMRQAKLARPTSYWLGKKRGPHSPEWKAKISAGVTGKIRSAETRERIRQALIGKSRPVEVVAKMRAAQADPVARAKMRASVFGKPQRHLKHPVFYNGLRMKSTYEVRAATAMDALGIRWEYEPRRFNLGAFTYAPDFFLPDDSAYWEIKGWFGPNSQRAVTAFRAQHPEIPLVVVDHSCLVMLESAAKRAA